jgi:hypothetical protein
MREDLDRMDHLDVVAHDPHGPASPDPASRYDELLQALAPEAGAPAVAPPPAANTQETRIP